MRRGVRSFGAAKFPLLAGDLADQPVFVRRVSGGCVEAI
jgi:hypothetical protein